MTMRMRRRKFARLYRSERRGELKTLLFDTGDSWI